MFGDVFGNRLAESVPVDGGDTPRSGSVISWQPLVEQVTAHSQKKYGVLRPAYRCCRCIWPRKRPPRHDDAFAAVRKLTSRPTARAPGDRACHGRIVTPPPGCSGLFGSAGYDPWTKTAYRLDRGLRWWCWAPRSVVWHASLHYTLGSVLFVLASLFALFVHVRSDIHLLRCAHPGPFTLSHVDSAASWSAVCVFDPVCIASLKSNRHSVRPARC
jgi:hypothetical protein